MTPEETIAAKFIVELRMLTPIARTIAFGEIRDAFCIHCGEFASASHGLECAYLIDEAIAELRNE
jgi:hypothetical protein